MKFRFRLESLLNHRESLKDEAQRVWMEAQNKVNVCLEEIQKMYNQVDESRQTIASSEKAGVSNQSAVFVSNNEFLAGQKIRIERKRQEARELMSIAEQKREEMVAAMQDHEVLKKLKEKKKQEFLKKKKTREAKEMDDLVTMRFTRSGS